MQYARADQKAHLSTERQVSSILKVRYPLPLEDQCPSQDQDRSCVSPYLWCVPFRCMVTPTYRTASRPTPDSCVVATWQSDFTPKHQPQGTEKWVYPSEQQYFNAMKVRVRSLGHSGSGQG